MIRSFALLVSLSALALAASCSRKANEADAPADAGAAEAAAPVSSADITADDLKRQIRTLSADEFEGRAPATEGGKKARSYIANEFRRLDLEPVNGSYFQAVPLVETTLAPEQSSFKFTDDKGQETKPAYKTDIVYWTKRVADSVAFDGADVVFVGYGVVAPEYQWNDYAGVDARGKTVIMLINDPGYATGDPALFTGKSMTYYGRWTYKYEEAARQGAAAALIIHDTAPAAYGWNVVETSRTGPQIDLQRPDDGASRVKVEGWLSNETAHALFSARGLDLDALTAAAKERGFKAVPLKGLKASATLTNAIRRSEDANVLGVLRGTEAPDEYVLYTAHWDHLGVDPDADGEDHIFNGAVDNATGVAAILEIAEKFATNKERPRRSILFAAVTAEESGLLGSAYMAEVPPVPLKDVVGGINIDGLLPTPPAKDIIVIGYGASELEDVLKEKADAKGRYLRPDAEPEKGYFYRSDHVNFAKKGVPMLYADSGIDLVDGGEAAGKALGDAYTAERYHQAADEFDEAWDLAGMTETIGILYETGAALAYSDRWPNWREGNEFRALRDAQRAAN